MATVIVGAIVALLFCNGIRVHLKMMRRGKQARAGEDALRLDLQRFGMPAQPEKRAGEQDPGDETQKRR